jgi:hypothetical protein
MASGKSWSQYPPSLFHRFTSLFVHESSAASRPHIMQFQEHKLHALDPNIFRANGSTQHTSHAKSSTWAPTSSTLNPQALNTTPKEFGLDPSFVWNKQGADWEAMYSKLAHFRAERGHANVPQHYKVLPCTLHPAPNTRHPAPGTRHPTPNTQHPTPNTQHPTPNTQHPTPNTQHPTPNT